MSSLRVTQHKSRNGADKSQLATLRSLGLRRIGQTVDVSDSPQTRGMLHKVRHLVDVAQSDPQGAGTTNGVKRTPSQS